MTIGAVGATQLSTAMLQQHQNYTGNGLSVEKNENNKVLRVIGNDCNVKVSQNNGTVEVIGNCCRVVIENGKGKIKYVGNSGRIETGGDVAKENISYVGNGGSINKKPHKGVIDTPIGDCFVQVTNVISNKVTGNARMKVTQVNASYFSNTCPGLFVQSNKIGVNAAGFTNKVFA